MIAMTKEQQVQQAGIAAQIQNQASKGTKAERPRPSVPNRPR